MSREITLLLERAFSHNSIGLLSAVSEVQYGTDGTVQDRSRTGYFYNAAGERVREVSNGRADWTAP